MPPYMYTTNVCLQNLDLKRPTDFNAPLALFTLLQLCNARAIPSRATQFSHAPWPGATLPNRALTWNQARICSHAEGLSNILKHFQTMSKIVQTCSKVFKHVQATDDTKGHKNHLPGKLGERLGELAMDIVGYVKSAAMPAKGTCITK